MIQLYQSRFIIILLSLLILAPSLSHGGAWPRSKGEVYSKVDVSYFESDQIFGPKQNKKLPGPDFTDLSTNLYAEYGFAPKLTGIISMTYKTLSSQLPGGPEQSNSGLADVWIYMRKAFFPKSFVIAFQGGVKIPMGYNEKTNPPLGEGQIDWEDRIQIGKSFYPFPGYGNVEIGYRFRNGDFSDEIPYLFELGVNVHKNVLVKVLMDGIDNRSNDAASKTGNRAANIFDQEYTKLGPGLIIRLKEGVSLEVAYSRVISGGNTAVGDTYSIGLSWQGTPASAE